MQSEQDNMTMLGHNGIVGHDSLTLSHSILEGKFIFLQNLGKYTYVEGALCALMIG